MELLISGKHFEIDAEPRQIAESAAAKLEENYVKLNSLRLVLSKERNWQIAEAVLSGGQGKVLGYPGLHRQCHRKAGQAVAAFHGKNQGQLGETRSGHQGKDLDISRIEGRTGRPGSPGRRRSLSLL